MTQSENFRETLIEIERKRLHGCFHTTIYVPPKEPITHVLSALSDEMKKANWKRHSVARNFKAQLISLETEISAMIFKFQFHMSMPENGVIVFCGFEKTTDYGLNRPINITVEPPQPVKEFKLIIGEHFDMEQAKMLI